MKKPTSLTMCMRLLGAIVAILLLASFCACTETGKDMGRTWEVGDTLANNQPTPTDIEYSLERFNLIRRAYWVNGKKAQALSLECSVARPVGFVTLFAANGAEVAKFKVDGKVTSLNSFLTPDSYYYSGGDRCVRWLPDVDGSYGENDNGIFFFALVGDNGDIEYVEWNGLYLYTSSQPELAKLDAQG